MRLIDLSTGYAVTAALLVGVTAVSVGAQPVGDVPVRPGHSTRHRVTVTNLTQGQTFTPILAVTHDEGVAFFAVGSAPSDELAALAEGGDTGPLDDVLAGTSGVVETQTVDGLLGPGQSVTFMVRSTRRASHLSLAAMLIPTNDAFFALDGVPLPRHGVETHRVVAYDAGSEPNSESCDDIPGPVCGGAGGSPGVGGEGFVHVHNGIHGIADLPESVYDWRNPVAMIRIEAE